MAGSYSANARRARRRSGDLLVSPDAKRVQRVGSEGRGDRHVGGVAAARDEDASDARGVVAGVEGVQGRPQISLEPSREVHRRRVLGNADVAEITGAITGGDVHAAAEGD